MILVAPASLLIHRFSSFSVLAGDQGFLISHKSSSSSFTQNAGYPQREIQDSQMFVRAIDKALINFRKDHHDLVLLLVGYGVVVHYLLVELQIRVSSSGYLIFGVKGVG